MLIYLNAFGLLIGTDKDLFIRKEALKLNFAPNANILHSHLIADSR